MSGLRTALSEGKVGCRRCALVAPIDATRCTRCGARLISRDRQSLSRVWFWWLLGILAYVPANIWPMLETRVLFETSEDTIIAGALKLLFHGSVGIAVVILLASVAIPVAKFAIIAWLALTVQYRLPSASKSRHRAFEVVEFVGRWSMIDVFVVAILVSLVQFSVLANVQPGPAALAFALSVIFTMLSALGFDSRLIWDADAPDAPAPSPGKRDDLAAVQKPSPPKG